MFKATVIQFQIILSPSRFDTQALCVAFYRFVIYDVSYLTVKTTTKRAFEAVLEWSRWVSDISFLQGLSFVCYAKHGETKPTYLNRSPFKCFPTLTSVGFLSHWQKEKKHLKSMLTIPLKLLDCIVHCDYLGPPKFGIKACRKCSYVYIISYSHQIIKNCQRINDVTLWIDQVPSYMFPHSCRISWHSKAVIVL